MTAQRANNLLAFFEPSSVAIFGSLNSTQAPGYVTIQHLQEFGFKGKIYPVNRSCSEVLGVTVYPDLERVTEPVDLAIIVIPPLAIPEIVAKCAQKGIKAIIIMSENFAEASEDGGRLQQQVVDIARRSGVRVIGPNTIGILNTANGLITTPYFMGYNTIPKGSIAYCCQSGLMSNVVHPLEDLAYPISKICDFGNKCDLNEVDLLNYLADDPETKVISMHLEDIKDGRAFMEAARRAVAKKPVLILKPGRSQAAAKASASHTGSLAGNDQIIDAAFKQAGVIRLNNWQEYWEMPRVFASQPLPKGNRVGFVTASGGAGVLALDAAAGAGLEVANFTEATLEKLAKLVPRMARNPVDLGPLMTVSDNPWVVPEQVLSIVMADDNVDCVSLMADWIIFQGALPTMETFHRLIMQSSKPATIFLYGSKQSAREELLRQLTVRGLATYLDLETSIKALGAAAAYSRIRARA
jgi:acetate---CoA ligase (ADP-forming)